MDFGERLHDELEKRGCERQEVPRDVTASACTRLVPFERVGLDQEQQESHHLSSSVLPLSS